jgi:hypothetical protein
MKSLENKFHVYLNNRRIKGEWFYLSESNVIELLTTYANIGNTMFMTRQEIYTHYERPKSTQDFYDDEEKDKKFFAELTK